LPSRLPQRRAFAHAHASVAVGRVVDVLLGRRGLLFFGDLVKLRDQC